MKKSTNKTITKKNAKHKQSTTGSNAPKSKSIVDLSLLTEVNVFMQSQGLVELKWSSSGVDLHLRRAEVVSANTAGLSSPIEPQIQKQELSLKNAPKVEPPKVVTKKINSPFVGTFYRSPSPNQKAFVDIGQIVKPGDCLCIIEAMKLMNEIESDLKGRIAKILIDNGTPVEYGEPLFEIEPL